MRIFLKPIPFLFCLLCMFQFAFAQNKIVKNENLYRPTIHFTPLSGWMNDPNGMFYKDGLYHLYYQHYPEATVWGPMHWGHATSTDLLHWKHQPIALYPDSIGMIFSGSAVVDENNTSGLGENGKAPIVAIFTQHNMAGEKAGKIDFQNQSIAYSNDNGYTWKMYAGNPVIKNPGINDFRDPKVIWHAASKKWIMTLAVKNKVSFYSSPNLIHWTKTADFGENIGNHGGVWECPDLFPLQYKDSTYWVLTSSINPGGPNKGSATQYFIGQFDGQSFTSLSQQTKWMDYGTDNYAGVTFSNTGNKRISIGWMSNWMYAQQVPTLKWRSALTIARNVKLDKVGTEFYLSSSPLSEIKFNKAGFVPETTQISPLPFKLSMQTKQLASYTVTLSNDLGESIQFGYHHANNQYFIDRTKAGISSFHKEFAAKHIAPRIAQHQHSNVEVIIDKTSIELFADDGLSVMTDIFFPSAAFHKLSIHTEDSVLKKSFQISYLNP